MAISQSEIPDPADTGAEPTRESPVYTPRADIYETAKETVILLDMPGVDIESASVTLDDRTLSVSGQAKDHAPTGYSLSHGEYQGGDFERSFSLAQGVDPASISASMKDGVLKLTISKQGAATAKRINVKAG